ncbi:unnamed protein product [Effrenium voratum]|nr:unnamed protein product [Effrenium voratum]
MLRFVLLGSLLVAAKSAPAVPNTTNVTSSRPKHASGALAHLRGGAIASASANVSKSNTTSHPAKMLQVQSPNATTHQSQGIYVQTRINLTNESSFAAVLRSWGPGGDASKSGGDASDRSDKSGGRRRRRRRRPGWGGGGGGRRRRRRPGGGWGGDGRRRGGDGRRRGGDWWR